MKNQLHTPRATVATLPPVLPVTLRYRDKADEQIDRANLAEADIWELAHQIIGKSNRPSSDWAEREAACRILFGWTQNKVDQILEVVESPLNLDEVIERAKEYV